MQQSPILPGYVESLPNAPEPDAPTPWFDAFTAGFMLENDVKNGYELLSRPGFATDTSYDVVEDLQAQGLWEQRWAFMNTKSKQDFEFRKAKLLREQQLRRDYLNGGWPGFLGAVAGGIISPTMLIPLVGTPRTGFQGLKQGLMLSTLAAGLQEIPLQMNQEERTAMESASSLIGQAVVGGLLGGLVGVLSKSDLQRIVDDMASSPDELAIPALGNDAARPVETSPENMRSLTLDEIQNYRNNSIDQLQAAYDAFDPAAIAREQDFIFETAEIRRRNKADEVANDNNGLGSLLPYLNGDEVKRLQELEREKEIMNRLQANILYERLRDVLPEGYRVERETARNGIMGRDLDALDGGVEQHFISIYNGDKYAGGITVGKRSPIDPEPSIANLRESVKKALENGPKFSESDIQKFLTKPEKQLATKTSGKFDPGESYKYGRRLDARLSDKEFDDFINDLEKNREPFTPSPKAPDANPGNDLVREPAPAGAQASFTPTKGVKKSAATKPIDAATAYISPVIKAIEQPGIADRMKLMTARWFMQQLSNAGVKMADNAEGIAVAGGGTIENLRNVHYAKFWKAQTKVDQIYADYVFDGKAPAFLMNPRAKWAGRAPGKLTKQQFMVETARAMRGESVNVDAARKAAEAYETEVMQPTYKDAVDAGIYSGVEEVVGDKEYLNRMFNAQMVRANFNEFVSILAKDFAEKLEAEFIESMKTFKARAADMQQFEADAMLPFETADALRKEFLARIKEIDEIPGKTNEARIAELREKLGDLRTQRKEWKSEIVDGQPTKAPDFEGHIKALKEQIKEEEKLLLPDDIELDRMKKEMKQRLRNLNKSLALQTAKGAAKLAKIERMEELSVNTLDRLVNRVSGVMLRLDRYESGLDKEIERLRRDFTKVAKQYDRVEQSIAAEPDFMKAMELGEQSDNFAGRLTDLAERLDISEGIDREYIRELFQQAVTDLEKASAKIVHRRGARIERLAEEAKRLDPKVVKERLEAAFKKNKERQSAFRDRWREKGLDNIDDALDGVPADFRNYATQRATEAAHAIAGLTVRLPQHDIIVGRHGAELARTLGISSSKIEKFLENDAEKLVRSYLRTLAPDIEIAKRFGDVNATRYLSTAADNPGLLKQEFDARMAELEKATGKDGKPLDEVAKQRASTKLVEHYAEMQKILQASIDRLRHTRAIPENPEGFAYRAGRLVMNLNVLRYMGMVTISSFSDVANLVLKHGLTRVFNDVFVPLITNFKQMQMTAREAYLAGEALDVYLHTRASALYDIMDEFTAQTSRFERGVEYASNRMGLIAGFDFWNREMKKLAAVASTAHMMDAMKLVMSGVGTAKERGKAAEYLASLGLDDRHIERIWKQVQEVTGGERVNGIWWPNTENWTDAEATKWFRQALSGEVSSTIVTPGLERPLWMDANIGLRMIGQFRSFAFSSMTKTLYAGLQEPDMALVNSTLLSLALGAFSYYAWAVATGGSALDEAMKFDPAKYADEAIARSGRLAIGQEAWELAQRLPFVRDYSTFSGQRTAQRQGMDFIEMFAGPSFDFANKAGAVILNLDDPTRSTANKFTALLPFQNLLYLRQAFDAIEAKFPERRD